MDSLSAAFAALADPTRRAILTRLAQGDARVGELGRPFRISAPAISRHLRVLEDAGLVEHRTAGTRSVYKVRMQGFASVREYLDGFWDVALSRLEELADE